MRVIEGHPNNAIVSAAVPVLLFQAAEIVARAKGVKLSTLIREALSDKVLQTAPKPGADDPLEATRA